MKLFEKHYENLRKEIEEIGYIELQKENVYFYKENVENCLNELREDTENYEQYVKDNYTEEDIKKYDLTEKDLRNEYEDVMKEAYEIYVERQLQNDFRLMSSDHTWLKIVAREKLGSNMFDMWTTEDYAHYVTKENYNKYENLYEFLIKEDVIFNDEIEETFKELMPEYYATKNIEL